MSDLLKEKANEISLMLVMTARGDTPGLQLVLTLCSELAQIAAKTGRDDIVAAVRHLEDLGETDERFDSLTVFASALNHALASDGPLEFPDKAAGVSGDPDLASSIDARFLAEYVETHTLLLDEFEETLIDYQRQPESEEIAIAVKRYLHNLKGDSGSIGLLGIERVCHEMEDALLQSPPALVIIQLLKFKEWTSQWLKTHVQGGAQRTTADMFLAELHAALTSVSAREPITNGSSGVPHAVTPAARPESAYSLTGERDILVEFATEAEEHLNNVESVILDSEGVYSKDAIDTIFRGVHSIKGGSAYFGLEEMTKCSHILENFLSEVRDGRRTFDTRLSELLLAYIDLQKDVLTRAKKAAASDGVMHRSKTSVEFLGRLHAYESNAADSTSDGRAQGAGAAAEPEGGKEADAKAEKLNVKSFLKVETGRLDHLIDSIGEMVIYSSMLIRQCRELLPDHPEVMDMTHRVEKFSRDLQDVGMSMRLVPIKSLFQKMSRLVWDMSKKLGKEVTFVMEGEDTELDRNLIDKLADPLMHMVRNSLDHGIETADEREKSGKPRNGLVRLSAFHSGGTIHIQIQDDGKGLNPEKLIAKAVEKGIVAEGQKLTLSETYQLIFAAGFSTAAKVTDISGRGVGMDVVRRNVESLRGRVHIDSKPGHGSTFTIELPLTLAIVDGIQIEVGNEQFLVPSLSIVEFVRPRPEMLVSALDVGETLLFRGKYLPIFRLSALYNIEPRHTNPIDATMLIVENNHDRVALMVDDIHGEYSTIIKSLGPVFEEGKGIAGCAIMPRGNVALILDVRSLIQLARDHYPRLVKHGSIVEGARLH